MRYFLLLAFCLVTMIGLKAQDAGDGSAQKPMPPYLAPVPDKLHWIVNYSYPPKTASGAATPPPPGSYPISVETVKVGNLRHISVTFINGPTQQFDIFGSNCFAQTSEGLELFKLGDDYQPFMFYDPGFLFTQGVNAGSFVERTTYQNVPVFHYKSDSTEAWIAVSTMLPIGADLIDHIKTTYQYLPTPTSGDVVLSPAEQKILDNRKLGEQIYRSMR